MKAPVSCGMLVGGITPKCGGGRAYCWQVNRTAGDSKLQGNNNDIRK